MTICDLVIDKFRHQARMIMAGVRYDCMRRDRTKKKSLLQGITNDKPATE